MVERVYYNLVEPAPIVFVDLFKARKWKNPKDGTEGKERYGAMYLLTPNGADHIALYNIIAAQAAANPAIASRSLDSLTIPLENGDVKVKEGGNEFYRGKVAFRAFSNAFNKDGSPRPKPNLYAEIAGRFAIVNSDDKAQVEQHFYAGVMAGGGFGFSSYDGMGGGVAAYLNEVLSKGYGERIADRGGDPTARNESLLKFAGRSSDINPLAARPAASAVAPTAASTSQF